ncbi:MAG: hypothetical protein ACRYG2_30640 [Janthinobacterium lividum]
MTTKFNITTAGAALALAGSLGLLTGCTSESVTGEDMQPVATESSYVLTSSKYNVSKFSDSQQIHGQCAAGSHVAGSWVSGGIVSRTADSKGEQSNKVWQATGLDAHGDYMSIKEADGQQQDGTDKNGDPIYQTVDVRLANASWVSSHTGWFTWTCDSN